MNHFEDEITIDEIVDSFSVRLEKGERPSIEEYKIKYPQLAGRIEAVLPALIVLENVDSDPTDRRLAVDDSIPEVLGEYQIIQEVGRGGMGIVFEAQHTTMRRRVALKVLPKSLAKRPNYLKRFLTEARSAGQLHHTNIVPVFEVGESDGLNFYSMQFIHGDNLDHVIDEMRSLREQSGNGAAGKPGNHQRHYQPKRNSELSQSIARDLILGQPENEAVTKTCVEVNNDIANKTPHTETESGLKSADQVVDAAKSKLTVFTEHSSATGQRVRNQYHHRVAAVGVQVAEALAHAHEHGVLHRDVKPANLILDTGGNVWITDFGLAKLDTHDLTQTGDIIGTLRYMAPERFAGEADPRSDIYSLGLTLYELATLRCAFENDRGTLVQDVANSSSVISPRNIDDAIPADLETIILKSIEPRPERRYPSAVDLANDLKLFLADRPIKARRASWAERCLRICRRNPVASSLSACLAILLVIVTTGSIQFARSEFKNRRETQKNLFHSKLDQAKMRRYSGRPGQRFEAMRSIRDAVALLPEMDFNDQQFLEQEFLLRSEVIAAISLTDIDRKWSLDFEPGWARRQRIAVDATGKYFAEGNDYGRIRIRNIDDHQVVHELPGGRGDDPSWLMHFSPDARYLIAKYHQGNVHNEFLTIVWDLNQGGRQAYVTRHTIEFCFSNNSKQIAIAYADRAEIVNLENGTVVKTVYPEFASAANALRIAFNSDASSIAISQAASGVVEFWNIERRPFLTNIVESTENVFCMNWDSAREIFVAGCHRGTLNYWIGSLSKAANVLQLHQNSIHEIHLHPHRELVATTAWDATTRFTDLVAGKEVLTVENHTLLYNGFCDNGRIGMLDDKGQIGIWQVSLPLIQTYSSPDEQGGGFTCCIHPQFKNIVGRTIGDRIEFWNTENRKRLLTINDMKSKEISFSDSGNRLFASGDRGLFRWDVNCDGRAIKMKNERHLIERRTGHFELFKDRKRLLIAVGSRLRIIDSATGQLIKEVGSHENLNQIQLAADDRIALSGTWHGKGIKIWGIATGQCIQTVNPETGSATPVSHPTDSLRFFVSRNETTEFFIAENDATEPVRLKKKLKHDGVITLLQNGDQMLVQTNSYNMVLLDTETQEELARIVSSGQSRIVDKSISSDGNTLVLACFDSLQVVDMKRFQEELDDLGIGW